jgi:hypothetical protein
VEKKVFPVTLDQMNVCSMFNKKRTRGIDTGKPHIGHVSSQKMLTCQTSDRTHSGPLTLQEAFDSEDGADELSEPALRWMQTVDKLIKLKPMEPRVSSEEETQLFLEVGENLASVQALYDLEGSWREDYPVDRIVIAMEDIFGCQLEPYTVYNPVFV